MRKTTKTVVGLLSLGVMGASWSLGQAAETGLTLDTTVPAGSAASETTNTAAPTGSATPSKSSQPTASASATKSAAPVSKSVTKTSDAVNYIAHNSQGTMQLKVTKAGGQITDITIVSGGTEGGQWASVPNMLAQYAIQAQGSDFGNLSNATHTTDAFKQALDNALAKF